MKGAKNILLMIMFIFLTNGFLYSEEYQSTSGSRPGSYVVSVSGIYKQVIRGTLYLAKRYEVHLRFYYFATPDILRYEGSYERSTGFFGEKHEEVVPESCPCSAGFIRYSKETWKEGGGGISWDRWENIWDATDGRIRIRTWLDWFDWQRIHYKIYEYGQAFTYEEVPSVSVSGGGYSAANPNDGSIWNQIIEVTPGYAKIRTYVYELWNIAGEYIGFTPARPEEIQIWFSAYGAISPGPPVLDTLPLLTSSSVITISGSAKPNAYVEIYVNGYSRKYFQNPSSGRFSEEVALISEGENVITAKCQGILTGILSPPSSPQTVILDTTPPVANAGPDQTVKRSAIVKFDGSGSYDPSPASGIDTYTWTFDYEGVPITLFGVTPTFTFDVDGAYTITLTVKDKAGNKNSDQIIVTVSEPLLAVSPWPMFRHDSLHTGRGATSGSSTGNILWQYNTGGSVKVSSPAIGSDGKIYIGSQGPSGNFYILNPDGSIYQSYSLDGPVYSSPAIEANGRVWVASYNGKLYSINPWGIFVLPGNIQSSPVIGLDGTTIYVCIGVRGMPGTLSAIDTATGNNIWNQPLQGDVIGSPAIDSNGNIYLATVNGILHAFNPDGTPRWTYTLASSYSVGVTASPAIGDDSTIYIPLDDKLYVVQDKGINNPSLKWGPKSLAPGNISSSSPAIGRDGTVYIGSTNSTVYALNGNNGSTIWTFGTGGPITSSPSIGLDGTIYVGSLDNFLYAINDNGTFKWKVNLGDYILSSPAIGLDGRIYVGSGNTTAGRLNAIGIPAGNSVSSDGMVEVDTAGVTIQRVTTPPYEAIRALESGNLKTVSYFYNITGITGAPTLTFKYNPSLVTTPESDLKLYKFNGTDWIAITTAANLDTDNNWIQTTFTSSSLLAVLERLEIEKRDTTPPVTVLYIEGPQYEVDGKIYTSLTSRYILASDDPLTNNYASGIDYTEYKVDDGVWQIYIASFSLPVGMHKITYRSKDRAGNLEEEKQITIYVSPDVTPPITMISIGEPKYDYGNGTPIVVSSKTLFTLTANDPEPDASGVDYSEYNINDTGWLKYYNSFSLPTYLSDGEIKVGYRSVDKAGNVEETKLITVTLDNSYPQALLLSPSSESSGIEQNINGIISVIGTALDLHFDYYKLEYGAGENPTSWQLISTSTNQVSEGELGKWDTTTLPEGTYTLRLIAVDKVENVGITTAKVVIGMPKFLLAILDELSHPDKITVDRDGYIYVADRENDCIKKLDHKGNYIKIGEDILNKSEGVALDNEGNIYVGSRNTSVIEKFDSQGDYVATIGRYYLNKVCGIKVDENGDIVVADRNEDFVRIFRGDGSLKYTIGVEELNKPEDVFIYKDKRGDKYYYVANRNADNIKIFNEYGGLIKTIDCGKLLLKPDGLLVTQNGLVIVADSNNSRVVKLDKYGNITLTINIAENKKFNHPKSVCFDSLGNLYVADSMNKRIIIFGNELPDVPDLKEEVSEVGKVKKGKTNIEELEEAIANKEKYWEDKKKEREEFWDKKKKERDDILDLPIKKREEEREKALKERWKHLEDEESKGKNSQENNSKGLVGVTTVIDSNTGEVIWDSSKSLLELHKGLEKLNAGIINQLNDNQGQEKNKQEDVEEGRGKSEDKGKDKSDKDHGKSDEEHGKGKKEKEDKGNNDNSGKKE